MACVFWGQGKSEASGNAFRIRRETEEVVETV